MDVVDHPCTATQHLMTVSREFTNLATRFALHLEVSAIDLTPKRDLGSLLPRRVHGTHIEHVWSGQVMVQKPPRAQSVWITIRDRGWQWWTMCFLKRTFTQSRFGSRTSRWLVNKSRLHNNSTLAVTGYLHLNLQESHMIRCPIGVTWHLLKCYVG